MIMLNKNKIIRRKINKNKKDKNIMKKLIVIFMEINKMKILINRLKIKNKKNVLT